MVLLDLPVILFLFCIVIINVMKYLDLAGNEFFRLAKNRNSHLVLRNVSLL